MNEEDIKWHWQESGHAWKGVGIYHVTLTVPSREPLLGMLVIPKNDPTQAHVERTQLGEELIHALFLIPYYHPEIKLLRFCLMPDHLHAVWYVCRAMPKGIMTAVRGFWQGAKKIGRKYTLSVTPNSIRDNEQRIIRDDEQKIFPVFTEMPFVRVMSRRGQLDAMMRYVAMNPQRLATKRLMPGFFRVQEGIKIGGMQYAGVGNAMLLQAERFMPVHVRRTLVEAAEHGETGPLRDYKNSCILAARKGTVMISPFISPHEKEIMNVLLREERLFIYLSDNGFRNYYKPADALFDACAAGRLLILSPWPYDEGKRHISRSECVALNQMAEEICKMSIS